jgi:hypothetical protein
MSTRIQLRTRENMSQGRLDSVNHKVILPELVFSFEIKELKALIQLLFSLFEKVNQIKKVLKNFELYRHRPMGIIRLSKFAREK